MTPVRPRVRYSMGLSLPDGAPWLRCGPCLLSARSTLSHQEAARDGPPSGAPAAGKSRGAVRSACPPSQGSGSAAVACVRRGGLTRQQVHGGQACCRPVNALMPAAWCAECSEGLSMIQPISGSPSCGGGGLSGRVRDEPVGLRPGVERSTQRLMRFLQPTCSDCPTRHGDVNAANWPAVIQHDRSV